MISDVSNQKTNGRRKRNDHARHVTAPGAAADEVPPRGNENGAHEVERGIERRQVSG